MDKQNHILLQRWLTAESDGQDAVAEQNLGALFSELPEASPADGFAERVLTALAASPTVAMLPTWAPATDLSRDTAVGLRSWWGRTAVAACLTSAGLATALFLPLALALSQVVSTSEATGALIQGFVSMASQIDELLSLWHVWARIVEITLMVATAPPVVLVLLTLATLSAFTFRGLKRALVTYRSPDHVLAS